MHTFHTTNLSKLIKFSSKHDDLKSNYHIISIPSPLFIFHKTHNKSFNHLHHTLYPNTSHKTLSKSQSNNLTSKHLHTHTSNQVPPSPALSQKPNLSIPTSLHIYSFHISSNPNIQRTQERASHQENSYPFFLPQDMSHIIISTHGHVILKFLKFVEK